METNLFTLMRGAGRQSGLDALVSDLNNTLGRASNKPSDEAFEGLTMATESLSGDTVKRETTFGEINRLQDLIASTLAGVESVNLNTMGMESLVQSVDGKSEPVSNALSPLSLSSAGYMAAAFANPVAYAEKALAQHDSFGAGVKVLHVANGGMGGTVRHEKAMALEAFSEQPTRQMMGWSIVMAATGAKQDPFTEAFFPYVMVGAGDMGLTLTLARSMIVRSPNHKNDGAINDLDRVNLIDAARNPELLESESTRLYPVVHQDPAHASRKFLVPGAATRTVEIEGNTFETAPIKFGEVGLINISTPDYLVVPGVMELTDAIGQGAKIEYVVLKVGNDLINLRTRELNGFGFLPAAEGQEERQVINATTKSLILDANTKNDRGQVPAALALLQTNKLTVRLGITIAGEINLQHSGAFLQGSLRSVYSIIDEDGNDVSTAPGSIGAQVLELLGDATLEGWYPFAARTNENMRTLGKLFETLEERFAYGIPTTDPFSVVAPIGSNRPAQNLETLVAAQRRRMNAAGVTTLLNHMEHCETHVAAKRAGLSVAEIGSVGARLTHPWFKRIGFDAKGIQSLRENDKALDLAAKITNLIRYWAAQMAVETGYTAALEASTRGSKQVRLLVGTSIPLHQQLLVEGDLRTFGPMFKDPIVVSTLNKKMDGKIVVTFTRDSEPGVPDELGFGFCAGLPELVTVVETRRGGSNRKEATTQGRYLHIPNLPFGFVIEVDNLEDALRDKSVYEFQEVNQGGNTPDPAPFPGGGSAP